MTERTLAQRWWAITAPYLVLRGAGQATEFVGWVVLARRLGAKGFGVLAVAALICRYGGLIADWGASVSGVREVAQSHHPGAFRALERRRRQTVVPLAVLYSVGAVLAGHRDLLMLVAVMPSIGLNRDWYSLGLGRGGRSATPVFVQGLVLLAVALLGPTSLPALSVSVAYAASLVLSLVLNRPPKAPAGEYKVDGWMLLAILSGNVLSTADTFLLAALGSVAQAGIYTAVYRLPNGWLAILVILRGGLLALATASLHDDHEQFLQLRRSSVRWGTIAAGALLAIIPLAFVAIPVVFGSAYRSGQWPAVLLLLGTAVATASAPLHHLFLAFGDDRPYGWYLFAAAALNVAVNLILIPAFGMMGAASATLLANTFLAAVIWRALAQRMREAGIDPSRHAGVEPPATEQQSGPPSDSPG